jgi:hypothetical protein
MCAPDLDLAKDWMPDHHVPRRLVDKEVTGKCLLRRAR